MWRRQAIAVLALVGVFVATYLWLYKIGLIGVLQCGEGSCEIVQASRYAMLFGIPVAFYGVAGYATLLVVGLISLAPAYAVRRGPDVALVALSSIGFAFTVYLTALELFVIHAVCRWCVTSAVLITAIWILSISALRRRL
jgi:uncharacterized membrane protein